MKTEEKLGKMVDFAKNLSLKEITQYAKENKYIRIGGKGYRAVSLCEETPLCGFSKNNSPNIETIKKHFTNTNNLEKPKKPVQERKIQCWLIKNALINNRNLINKSILSKSKYFDRLIFALDELSLDDKKVRCDILTIGSKGNKTFPVLIELKSARLKTELTNQLEKFCEEIKKDKEALCNLLKTCTGIEQDIDMGEVKKMIIWPKSESVKNKTKEIKGIYVWEYEYRENAPYCIVEK